MLRVQLINSTFGTVTLNEVDPDGLREFEMELKRSKDHDGVFYEFGINLKFNKQGRKFIQQVYEMEGISGLIVVNLYEYNPNTYAWVNIFTGSLKLDNYEIDEITLTTNIEQAGFERSFLNQLKRDVQFTNLITLPLAPKTIKKKAIFQGTGEYIHDGAQLGFHKFIRVGGSKSSTDFEKGFLSTDGWAVGSDTEFPDDTKNYILEATEGGAYVFDIAINITHGIEVGIYFDSSTLEEYINLTSETFKILYQKNNETPIELYNQTFTPGSNDPENHSVGTFDRIAPNTEGGLMFRWEKDITSSTTINDTLQPGDEIYLWFDVSIDYVGPGDSQSKVDVTLNGIPYNPATYVEITGDTVFPETNTAAVLAYEFFEQIAQQITGQTDCFYSEVLGRTDLGYAADGEASLIAITNGANIRGIDKAIFGSWEDAFTSFTSIFCLAWGFETIDNTTKIRVEKKEHFYSSETVLNLGPVAKLRKVVVRELYYQTVEVGYPEVENINQVNGIDEFNTLRKFTSPIAQAKGELKLLSVYRASGFEIESQRRLFGSTKESKLDDKNFLICVKRSGGSYIVEQGEDFTITGVFDPDTAYNVRIRPANMVRNWSKVLASNVIRGDNKTFAFSYGDYNYEMVEGGIAENDDIDLSEVKPLWYPEEYHFETGLNRSERALMRDNPRGIIKAEDWAGRTISGYIESGKTILVNNKAIMILRRSV